jgi:succinate dehydrogenase / fumarate reductase iron-sulfur subunit/fumarate reductase iron-sulfur subunit
MVHAGHVKINGSPSLACRTLASKKMLIEPLSNLPIVRDPVVDHTAFRDKSVKLRPFLQRGRIAEKEPEELLQGFSTFRVLSRCISCVAYVSKCPTFTETRHLYSSPAIIAEIGRFAFDLRDSNDRLLIALSGGNI